MAFRIRRKRKGSQKTKQGKAMIADNDKADKEKLQEYAEWDVIAESSRRPHRDEFNLDSLDEET